MKTSFPFLRRRTLHFLRSSFTLIELLVVMTIISILAGMLLPALNGARAKAKDIQCVNNLKQLSLYLLMYADQNRGIIPSPNRNFSASGEGSWQDAILTLSEPNRERSHHYFAERQSNGTYVPRPLFACPSQNKAWEPQNNQVHYGINAVGFASNNDGIRRTALGRIRNPSNRAALFDMDFTSIGQWPDAAAGTKSELIQNADDWRHQTNAGANVAFADGHVSGMPSAAIPNNSSDASTGYFWKQNGELWD